MGRKYGRYDRGGGILDTLAQRVEDKACHGRLTYLVVTIWKDLH